MRSFFRNGALIALTGAAISCAAAAPPAPPPLPPLAPPPSPAIPLVHPARYLVPGASWIERAEGRIDRVVINGRRMEISGVETTHLGPPEPEIAGGAKAPAWLGPGPCRYVFWKGKDLFCADSFLGDLRPTATLPVEPQRAFDWINGTGILLPGGALVVPIQGGPLAKINVAAVGNALAADARRAVVVTALGHVLLSTDGAGSFRDASATLAPAASLFVRGDDLIIHQSDGRGESLLRTSGEIAPDLSHIGVRRGEPPPEDNTDLWPRGAEGALFAAVRSGLPLSDGGAVIAARGVVGRLDLKTLRTTSIATLDGVAPDADCHAFRAADATLLACASQERASLVDVTGVPRLERTFELTGAPDADRFVGVDGEAIAYLGSCDGRPPRHPPPEGSLGVDSYEARSSAVLCVRKSREQWIEHRLDPGDADDVIGWIPRRGGGAVAIVGRAGTVLSDRERVLVRGDLRVVRVARNEPPFSFQQYAYRSSSVLSRGLRAYADDVIEGWIAGGSVSQSMMAITIDASGHARAYATPPRSNQILTAGRAAIAEGDDGRLFETVDAGHHWAEIDPPPGAAYAYPSQCSPLGCQIGPFVRIGWSADEARDKTPDPLPAKSRAARERERGYAGRQVAPPLVRLSCSFDGPADGKRSSDTNGFGATSWPQPRGAMAMRLGAVGAGMFPWNGAQPSVTGDADLAWVTPLDLTGAIHRTTLSLARAGFTAGSRRVYEVKLGYIIDAAGGLDVIATGYRDACLSSLLDVTGVTRSLGGCADDPAVGVDLGGKVLVVHPSYDALVVSAADAPPRRKVAETKSTPKDKSAKKDPKKEKEESAAPTLPKIPVALRELARTPLGVSTRGMTYGAGVREGAPVVIAVDASGAAFLAPIDPERGTLGAEEPLAALTSLALGDLGVCAGARPGEARVALPFDSEIGLDRASLRGVVATGQSGIAVVRWSRDRACLDAIELSVRDERYDMDLGPYDPSGTLRKLIARFTGAGAGVGAREKSKGTGTLLLIANGMELRQPVSCSAILVGEGER